MKGFVFTLDAMIGIVAMVIVIGTLSLLFIAPPNLYEKYVKARDYLEMKYYNKTLGVPFEGLDDYIDQCQNGLKVSLYYWDNESNQVKKLEVEVC